jgi:hypothetical protein
MIRDPAQGESSRGPAFKSSVDEWRAQLLAKRREAGGLTDAEASELAGLLSQTERPSSSPAVSDEEHWPEYVGRGIWTVGDIPQTDRFGKEILEIVRGSPTMWEKEALYEHLLGLLGGVKAVKHREQKNLHKVFRRRYYAALAHFIRGRAITVVREPPNVWYAITPLGRDMPDSEMKRWLDRIVPDDDSGIWLAGLTEARRETGWAAVTDWGGDWGGDWG